MDELSLRQRKADFLARISSPGGKMKYKRYLGTPLRYAGGKSLAVGLLIELLPDDTKRVVSPFFGGGSFEVACAIELGLPVIGYDIFDVLVNYWNQQTDHPEALFRRLAHFEPNRSTFKAVKERLKLHWKGGERLNDKDLAAYYYFNHNTSYGPHFLGWPSSVYLQKVRYQKMIEKVRVFKAPTLQVRVASFEDIMKKHRDDFLYLDPPYYLGGDSKTFIGMYPHRNFPIHHKGFRHDLLRELLNEHRGGFVLSYNDCTPVRQMYRGIDMLEPKWQYTFSQGDTRIGENRMRDNQGSHIKQSHELIIWQLPKNARKKETRTNTRKSARSETARAR